jgi:hypothetical protein
MLYIAAVRYVALTHPTNRDRDGGASSPSPLMGEGGEGEEL